jgi:hypothetical protein
MSIGFQVEQRPHYAVIRVDGEPTLGEFVAFVQEIAQLSRSWPVKRALVDLRAIRSIKSFTEHYAIGEAVAQHMGHLRQVASVVSADRLTRASEKTAQQAGFNLAVFTSEGEAIAWLTASSSP